MREVEGAEFEPVRRALEVLAAEMASEEAPRHVEDALVQAYRRQRRRSWAPVWVGGIAAAFAVAVYVPVNSGVETLPPPRIVHASAPPAFAKAPAFARASAGKSAGKSVRKAAPVRPVEVQEVASDFFPLRAGPMWEPAGFTPVVRVQLRRAEMRRFGLPVNADMSEFIPADIVLGQDGMARAIRFVSMSRGRE